MKFCSRTRPIMVMAMWRLFTLIKFHDNFFFSFFFYVDTQVTHWSSNLSSNSAREAGGTDLQLVQQHCWHCLNAMVSDREIKNLNSTLTRLLLLLYLIVQNFLAIAALQKEKWPIQSLSPIASRLKLHFWKNVNLDFRGTLTCPLTKIRYIVISFLWNFILHPLKEF